VKAEKAAAARRRQRLRGRARASGRRGGRAGGGRREREKAAAEKAAAEEKAAQSAFLVCRSACERIPTFLWFRPRREVARRARRADRRRHGKVSTTRSGEYGRIAE